MRSIVLLILAFALVQCLQPPPAAAQTRTSSTVWVPTAFVHRCMAVEKERDQMLLARTSTAPALVIEPVAAAPGPSWLGAGLGAVAIGAAASVVTWLIVR